MLNFFRKNKVEKQPVEQKPISDQAQGQLSSSTQSQNERHISQLEQYIENAQSNDPLLGDILLEAGRSYLFGRHHATINHNKALQYFKKANSLNYNGSSFHLGLYYAVYDNGASFEGDKKAAIAVAGMHLKNAHLEGDNNATELLNDMIQGGAFKGTSIDSIESLLNFYSK